MSDGDDRPDPNLLPLDDEVEARPSRQSRDVVKYGGIAKSDADVEDVSRDTYGTPIGQGGTAGGEHDTDNEGNT